VNHLSFRKTVGALLGEAVIWLRPKSIQQSEQVFASETIWQRLTKAAVYRRAVLSSNQSELEELHRRYWSSQEADRFFDQIRGRGLEHLQSHHSEIIDWMRELMADRPNTFRQLCEIGSGNGRVLNYLSQVFPDIETFTGIDVSIRQTARTQEQYRDSRLHFVADDGLNWLEAHATPGFLVSTHGGVLEYFTEPRVKRLFELIGSKAAPSAVAIVEPLDEDFSLAKELRSRPAGQELTFSHNYPLLAWQAGLEVLHQKDVVYPFGRRLMMVAASSKPS
jgi:SAM-dependent methyltransferase